MYKSEELNKALPYAFGNELEWLRTFAATLEEFSSVVMLGAGPGVMGMALLEGNAGIDLTIVDIATTIYAQAHIKAMATPYKVHFVISDSSEYAKEYDQEVDFLIVDGDHTYNGVRNDILAWQNKVKVGGHIFFHDVIDLEKAGRNGVKKAVQINLSHCYEPIDSPGISEVYKRIR